MILQAKASELHKGLSKARKDKAVEVFTASSGWLWRFCECHNIWQLSLQGEKLSADKLDDKLFIPEFQSFIRDSGYSLDQIFNCNDTSLYYKLLLQKYLTAHLRSLLMDAKH